MESVRPQRKAGRVAISGRACHMHYVVMPEVAEGWGESIVVDRSVHPPIVSKLEYEMLGWPHDDLLESFPVYVVTERLAIALEGSGMTGFSFDEVLITTSE